MERALSFGKVVMSPFKIQKLNTSGTPLFIKKIPAKDLEVIINEHAKLVSARSAAAKVLRKSRRERREILKKSRDIAAIEQERELIELRALLSQETQDAVSEAVKIIVEEERIESVIFNGLKKKAISWAVDIIKQWVDDLDWNKVMTAKVAELARQQSSESGLTLYVNPLCMDSIKSRLPGNIPWRIEGDRTLNQHHAILESMLMRINIDLDEQFELLLAQFEMVLSRPVEIVNKYE